MARQEQESRPLRESELRASGTKRGLSVIVPVYNSARTLPVLLARLAAVLIEIHTPYEIILVNDGSGDSSWSKIEELSHQYPCAVGINLRRNYGQHNAVLCGIRSAHYDVIVTLDDDLQNPPEEIPRLLAKLEEGHDVVYGRPEAERHGLMRDMASRVTKLALKSAMGVDVADSVSAFRAFRASLRDAFADYESSFISIDVLLTWGTKSFASIRVRHENRKDGRSNYTVGSLMLHAANMMTGFSTRPLQLATFIGFGLACFGVCVLGYVIGRYFVQGNPVRGFPFLAAIISIFSGSQLFALGIMGEYMARIHFRTMQKPQYVIRDIIQGDK